MNLEMIHCDFCGRGVPHRLLDGDQVLALKLPLSMPGGQENPWTCRYAVCLHCHSVWHLAIRKVRLEPDQLDAIIGKRKR